MSPYAATDYIDVATRIVEFRDKHPSGSLQPAQLDQPYRIETIGDQMFIVVVAAAYRTPDDPRPGVGMAYEPFPGKTNFTRGSELQNAETSAWGRAIVAALAADTKHGIASADEVRGRTAKPDRSVPEPEPVRARAKPAERPAPQQVSTPAVSTPAQAPTERPITDAQLRHIQTLFSKGGFKVSEQRHDFIKQQLGIDVTNTNQLSAAQASRLVDELNALAAAKVPAVDHGGDPWFAGVQ